jgi:hypothetical protein
MPEQNWWNCLHAMGAARGYGIPSKMIVKGELYDMYGCLNEKILELNAYPKETIEFMDGCGGRLEGREMTVLAYVNGLDRFVSEEDKKGIELKIDIKTAACRHCKFHDMK